MTRRIVEAHSAELSITCAPGGVSALTVSLGRVVSSAARVRAAERAPLRCAFIPSLTEHAQGCVAFLPFEAIGPETHTPAMGGSDGSG